MRSVSQVCKATRWSPSRFCMNFRIARILNWAKTPAGRILTVVAVPLEAVLTAVYSAELKACSPFGSSALFSDFGPPMVYGVALYLCYAGLAALPSTLRSEAAIFTKFATLYANCRAAVRVGDSKEKRVRLILSEIASLAQALDEVSEQYSATLMRFQERLPEAKVLFPSGAPVSGYLVLTKELSARSGDPEREDPNVDSMALEIPSKHRLHDNRLLVLPGAPKAYATGEPNHFIDTRKLTRWCARHGSYPPHVVETVSKFFRNSRVGGFASIPVKPVDGEAQWVLNVHRASPGLLRGRERAYYALLRPLLDQLLLALDEM